IISWQRALRLVYTDRANVVDEEYRTYSFTDWCELSKLIKEHPAGFIHTPKLKIAIPEVIALRFYDKVPFREVKFTRRNIYEHYGYRCCYCGKKFPSEKLNLDHVVPRARGGKTNWENMVTSCIDCNLKKGDRLIEEVNMKLKIKPTRPQTSPGLSVILKSPIKVKSSWQKFIDNVYWNIELDKD
ncbi:MAG: HNH endonuclease, partial [Elusimicrobiota bacterium]|nr:HNH endonuclease [Elusimicrobiota bacterium]